MSEEVQRSVLIAERGIERVFDEFQFAVFEDKVEQVRAVGEQFKADIDRIQRNYESGQQIRQHGTAHDDGAAVQPHPAVDVVPIERFDRVEQYCERDFWGF